MIVLDTHVLIWWLNGSPELSTKAQSCIEAEQAADDGLVLVSAISAWELAMLVEKGRLTLTMSVDDWLAEAEQVPGLRFVPVDNLLSVQSTRLPGGFHKDPADRMIVSLARQHNATLVTADQNIRAYPHVKTLW